jgi:hypothetical protein
LRKFLKCSGASRIMKPLREDLKLFQKLIEEMGYHQTPTVISESDRPIVPTFLERDSFDDQELFNRLYQTFPPPCECSSAHQVNLFLSNPLSKNANTIQNSASRNNIRLFMSTSLNLEKSRKLEWWMVELEPAHESGKYHNWCFITRQSSHHYRNRNYS